MICITIETPSGPIAAWRGGRGEHLILIHGGWAGAEAHWGRVWTPLSNDFEVTAIELGDLHGHLDQAHANYDVLAGRCASLLDALAIRNAVIVGNSLGASVGWQLALARPDLARQLVMVNGFPPRPLPLSRLLTHWPLSTLAMKSLIRTFYSPQTLAQAFKNDEDIPDEIRRNLTLYGPAMAKTMFGLLASVRAASGVPSIPVDYLWGEADMLPGVRLSDAKALQLKTPGARLIGIPGAGHLPQVDHPQIFVSELRTLIRA